MDFLLISFAIPNFNNIFTASPLLPKELPRMRQILIVLLMCGAIYGQGTSKASDFERLLLASDFKPTEGRMICTAAPCRIKLDESIHKIQVSVVCQRQAFQQTGLEKINEMLLLANDKIRKTLAEEHIYKPSEIKMVYNPELKAWSMTNLFTVTDEVGASKKNML